MAISKPAPPPTTSIASYAPLVPATPSAADFSTVHSLRVSTPLAARVTTRASVPAVPLTTSTRNASRCCASTARSQTTGDEPACGALLGSNANVALSSSVATTSSVLDVPAPPSAVSKPSRKITMIVVDVEVLSEGSESPTDATVAVLTIVSSTAVVSTTADTK